MRVLHVIPSIAPERGGPSTVIFPMVRALRASGLEVEIATTDDGLERPVADSSGDLRSIEGVPVRIFHAWSLPGRALGNFGYAPGFTRWLRRAAPEFDLLHVHAIFSYLSTAAMHVARTAGLPYINRPLGQLGLWSLRQSRGRKAIYWRLVEQANLRQAAALHFTSAAERDEAAGLALGTRTAVVAHGVELPPAIDRAGARSRLGARLQIAPGRKIVLFLGRLHAKKGIDLLLRAFLRLPAGSALLVVAGEGEAATALRREVAWSAAAPSVVFTGFLQGADKQLFLAGADLFALTSHHENMGVAVLEALAWGTPVLLSPRVPLAAAIAREELGAVTALEVSAIAESLRGLLEEPEQGRDPIAEGEKRRAFVREHHTWAKQAELLDRLYRQCGRPGKPSVAATRG